MGNPGPAVARRARRHADPRRGVERPPYRLEPSRGRRGRVAGDAMRDVGRQARPRGVRRAPDHVSGDRRGGASGRAGLRHEARGERRRRGKSLDWPGLIAHACASTGWTADAVLDQMTWDLWAAFQNEWRLRPPVHWLVAAFMDFKPSAAPLPGASPDAPSGRSLARDFKGGAIR